METFDGGPVRNHLRYSFPEWKVRTHSTRNVATLDVTVKLDFDGARNGLIVEPLFYTTVVTVFARVGGVLRGLFTGKRPSLWSRDATFLHSVGC
jgi:hypothetical protein